VDSSLKARLTTSTASRIEMDCRTSDLVSSLIIQPVGLVNYGIFDICIQEPIDFARAAATATVRERLNTHAEIA